MSKCTSCLIEGKQVKFIFSYFICLPYMYWLIISSPKGLYSEIQHLSRFIIHLNLLCLFFRLSSSDKSKRRTKTVKKSSEPKWNQTFIYSHVHRRDFRERMLEITVWDQPRAQEEESEFLGEVSHTSQCPSTRLHGGLSKYHFYGS